MKLVFQKNLRIRTKTALTVIIRSNSNRIKLYTYFIEKLEILKLKLIVYCSFIDYLKMNEERTLII